MKTYDEIATCAARYAAAQAALAETGADSGLGGYEAVLQARVALASCLVAAGWTPPPNEQALLDIDRRLLAQPRGCIEADADAG